MKLSKLLAPTAIALSFATQSFADDLRDFAKEYLALEANQLVMVSMFSAETFASQFATTLPPQMTGDETKLLAAGQVMSNAMMSILPEIEAAMLEATVKHFTLEELQMLYDLYSSELGISIAQKMSVYFTDAMAEMNPRVLEVSTQATPEILAILNSE